MFPLMFRAAGGFASPRRTRDFFRSQRARQLGSRRVSQTPRIGHSITWRGPVAPLDGPWDRLGLAIWIPQGYDLRTPCHGPWGPKAPGSQATWDPLVLALGPPWGTHMGTHEGLLGDPYTGLSGPDRSSYRSSGHVA